MSEGATRACLGGPGGRSDWFSGAVVVGEKEGEAVKSELILGNF